MRPLKPGQTLYRVVPDGRRHVLEVWTVTQRRRHPFLSDRWDWCLRRQWDGPRTERAKIPEDGLLSSRWAASKREAYRKGIAWQEAAIERYLGYQQEAIAGGATPEEVAEWKREIADERTALTTMRRAM
jgi:hypothetical protein